MGGGSTKLFHAIVGLGLAAAGCGGQVSPTAADVPLPKGTGAEGGGDAGSEKADAPVGADAKLPLLDATFSFPDATLVIDAGLSPDGSELFDAAMAHDAAIDVAMRPPPPEIK